MKVAERVLERRLRQAVEIDKMQFGFRPGTGTTEIDRRYGFMSHTPCFHRARTVPNC